MTGPLFLGFLIGLRHAFEADHVAAVATLASRSHSLGESLRQGAMWGVGHTLTLVLFGSAVLVVGLSIGDWLASALELGVGLMLVVLGVDVVRRLITERVHFHAHQHPDGQRHFHAHAHAGDGSRHDPVRHAHEHPNRAGFPLRALTVGLVHGMAGSAALILLTVNETPGPLVGLVYILLFGAGSILGMSALSIAIALPLRFTARWLSWGNHALVAILGVVTIGIGLSIVFHQLAAS